jgi:hypothetical protein
MACVGKWRRDPAVGSIDETGISLNNLGGEVIPWSELSSYSIEEIGEGEKVICLHRVKERSHISALDSLRALMLRRPFVSSSALIVNPSTLDIPMQTLLDRIRRQIPERCV